MTACPVVPLSALVPNTHGRGTGGVRTTPPPRPARRWSRMIDRAREAVRSLDMAIDFGTASVRVTTSSQHVRERRSATASGARSLVVWWRIVRPRVKCCVRF
jgi:hypothetical protein